MLAPNDWRFSFPRYVKADTPERVLFANVLDSYFRDIDLMSHRKDLSPEKLRKVQLSLYKSSSLQPVTIDNIRSQINSSWTRDMCDFVNISHCRFIKLFNKYMKYRLNFDLNDI